MTEDCPTCGTVGTLKEVRSPQPDEDGGIEYVKFYKCTYCGDTKF